MSVIPAETHEDEDNPFEIEEKVLTKSEIEKLSQKIERYIKQSRFSDNDKRYIVLLCRQEADHYTETKTGIHLNINKYSGKTLYQVQEYVEKCEETWKNAEKDAINQQEIRKKNRENQTVNFFKKRTDEDEENEEKEKSTNRMSTVENNPQTNTMMINFGVDNKKKPLNEYKGIYQRIMRKSRAIKNYKSIDNSKKKRTTGPILGGIEETPDLYIKEEEEPEEENEYEDLEEECEEEELDECEEDDKFDEDEEEEEVSSIIEEDSEEKYRDSGDEDSSNLEFEDRGDLDALTEKYQ